MNFRFLRDLQAQPDDSIFSNFGNEIYASFIPSVASHGGDSLVSTVLGLSPIPSFWNQGSSSTVTLTQAASGVAVTAGGIVINLLFDAAAMAAPASFRAGIQQAAGILATTISDKITVNLAIDYGGTGGGAAAGPDHGVYVNYSSVRSYLVNNAMPGDGAFNALPGGSSIQGQSNVAVWNAQLKLWGLMGANDTTTDDGSATFATDIDPSLLVGVALHELTHAVGRIPYGPQPDVFDLFRFTSVGTRLFAGGDTAPAAYFSVDGGTTKLADYGRNSDPSDFLNSGVQGPNDPFNEFYTYNTSQGLTTVDKQQLDVLGFHTLAPVTTTVIEALGLTKLVQVGTNFYLDSISSGTGPELKIGGAAVVAGQFGGYAPIGVEQTSTGYEVAWKAAGVDQYSVWATDSNGNYTSNLVMPGSGTSLSLETIETSFHQDLNGDGVIGVPASSVPTVSGTAIEAFGSASLVQVGTNFYLDSISSGTGPELKFGGAAVVAGQFGAYAPIGVEQTSTGYEVAWKAAGVDQYSVWATDSSGNYTSNLVMPGSGTSLSLETIETSFHQDLNGDGVIGVPVTAIEAFGSSKLVEVGNNFYLDSISTGTGPSLKYGGAAVVAGQFGGYAPIGVEQTPTGYEVAWKAAGVDQYSVWATDSNGNYTSNLVMPGSGTSLSLETIETSFHQDLNGDGVIGVAAAQAPSGASSASASQAASVMIASNDTFVFRPGMGADVIANAGSTDTIELDGFSSVTSNTQLAALLSEAQTGQPQALFQSTNGDHDTMINLGNHDSITLMNVHIADLHASNFLIH
jgi:serralysin